jgi:hypothetical protein
MDKSIMNAKEIGKKYRAGEINSISIENCRGYIQWICDTDGATPDTWKSWIITRDNRETFKSIWGKMDFSYNGSEFYFHAWVKEFEGETFLVLTAKGKGTCIEMMAEGNYRSIDSKLDLIKRFIESILKDIKIKESS